MPLLEELALPDDVRARANPKSSTGRLDVFTRVLTDRSHRFDEIAPGYHGRLYLEVVPRSFAIRVRTGLALNQVRLLDGDARLDDGALARLHARMPLLYHDGVPVPAAELSLGGGLFVSLDLSGDPDRIVGYRAKKNSLPIDLSQIGELAWRDFWEPVHPERGRSHRARARDLLPAALGRGREHPPRLRGRDARLRPDRGELRTHYAGFFDPGFGYSGTDGAHGSRAALEVRARDVPFMVEHRQPVCKLAFERMAAEPDVLYGAEAGSSYQGQQTMLEQALRRAGRRAPARRAARVRAGGVPSHATMILAVKHSAMPVLLTLLAAALSACATTATTSSSFKGEQHAAAQRIANLQSAATAGEAGKICKQLLSRRARRASERLGRRLPAGDQEAARRDRQLRSHRAVGEARRQRRHADRDGRVKSIYAGKNALSTLTLVKEGGAWKISGLG